MNLGYFLAIVDKAKGLFGATIGAKIPAAIQDRLIAVQFERAGRLVPLLYLTIGINTIAAALAAQGDFPIIYQLVFPGIMIAASVYRYFIWQRRKTKEIDPSTAKKHLRSITNIALALSLLGGFWCLAAFYETHETRRMLVPVFIVMSAIATATCLASLPRAAIGSVVLALAPIIVVMLFSSDLGLKAMGISIAMISILMIRLVLSNFSEMIEGLKLQQELKTLSETDSLTGLANRRAFTAKFEETAQNMDAGNSIALMMIDLDGFKAANDEYGHVAGDDILIAVAERLNTLCAGSVCIARLGGDEFAVLFGAGHGQESHRDYKKAIGKILSLPYVSEGQKIMLSASIGMATSDKKDGKISSLLRKADRELYAAKPIPRASRRR